MLILDNIYAITADKYNFILLKKKNDKYKRIGFFRTIDGAIEKYINELIKNEIQTNNLKNINELINYLKNTKKDLLNKIKELNILKTKYKN